MRKCKAPFVTPDGPAMYQTEYYPNLFIQKLADQDHQVKKERQKEIQATAENPHVRQQNETNNISTQLDGLNREEFLEEKRRQQLQENAEELRQLRIQLQAAEIKRQLMEQRALHARSKVDAERRKQEEARQVKVQSRHYEESLREKEQKEILKKIQLRQELQKQMLESEKHRQEELERKMREREERIREEQKLEALCKAEREEHLQRKEREKMQVMNFLRLREETKRRQHLDEKDESKQFLEVQRLREEQRKAFALTVREKRERKEALSEQIGQQLFALKHEKLEKENQLLDLLVEERKAKDDIRFRLNLEKEARDHEMLRLNLETYMRKAIAHKKYEREYEEHLFREERDAFSELYKKKEQEEEKNRQNKYQYGRQLMEMIEYQQRKRAAEAAERRKDAEILKEMELKRQKAIEAERIRILRNQTPELLSYLPPALQRQYYTEDMPRAPPPVCTRRTHEE